MAIGHDKGSTTQLPLNMQVARHDLWRVSRCLWLVGLKNGGGWLNDGL